jgi:hypothetical protein
MPEYSISQLGNFEECALQYKFIYVDGIKRYEEGGVEAFDPFALEKTVAEVKWGPEVLERLRAYLSTEKRYTVTFKEETKD